MSLGKFRSKHPQESSNGFAERAVQSFKQGIKKTPGKNIQDSLSKFLFKYRITPHSTTGVPPAELLMGRRLRSKLDLLYPELSDKVEKEQMRQKHSHDSGKPTRTFTIGDHVYAKNFSNTGSKWLSGTVVDVTGPLSYCIELQDGYTVRRHVDSLRQGVESLNPPVVERSVSPMLDPTLGPDVYPVTPTITEEPLPLPPPELIVTPPRELNTPPPPPRRSVRQRHPPDYFSQGL